MGKNVVILGSQWGDEGKGKIVDLLTDKAALVARFQGGHKRWPYISYRRQENGTTPYSIRYFARPCYLCDWQWCGGRPGCTA